MEYYDELVSNFDLNHLLGENAENAQVPVPQDRAKNATLWLKSKIISSDMLIQNYLTKSEDFVQAVKAHAVTKDELKHVCINYKETMEKCEILENEKKVLIANQEVLQNKAADAENKYCALISHTNQLKSLVDELKTEKEALLLEKQLEKGNDKKLILLQKEKEALLNDILNLKEALRCKKKKGKRQEKGLKKYGKQKQSDVSVICTSDESDNEKNSIDEVHTYASKNLVSNSDHHFMDIDSDSSNGQISVDTGRGSSRANSEKCLLSPDYFIPETPLKADEKFDVKKVDVASSPIPVLMVGQSVSVSTSPSRFDCSGSLFEDFYGHQKDGDFDGPDYIIDDIPLCGDDVTINKSFVDACTSPISISPDICKFVDTGTSPIKSGKDISCRDENNEKQINGHINLLARNESNIESIFIENNSPKGCRKKQKTLVDVGTNTDIKSPDCLKFVNKETNTDTYNEDINYDIKNKKCVTKSLFTNKDDIVDFNLELVNEKVQTCDKSTCTHIEIVHACTSPVPKSLIDRGTSPFQNITNSVTDNSHKKSSQESVNEIEVQISHELKKSISNERTSHKAQDLISQEKMCLENHNSNNLNDNNNDSEVQQILNVMKLHPNALSPIPKTPFKTQESQSTTIETLLSDYERSELKFNQLMNYMEDFRGLMTRNISELRNKCSSNISKEFCEVTIASPIEIDDVAELSESRTDKEKGSAQKKQIISNLEKDKILETDIVGIRHSSNVGKSSIAKDHTCNNIVENVSSEPDVNKDNKISKSQHTTSDIDLCKAEKSKPNNSKIFDVTEDNIEMNCSEMPKVKNVNAFKSRKISKLEKLRHKLIPTSKIKSVITSPAKKARKSCKIKLKDINSPSLDHDIAYQKAVKVMAELRSKQKPQEKNAVESTTNQISQGKESTTLESLGKTNLSPRRELFASNISTRSCTRRQSEKEDAIVTNTAEKQVVLDKTSSEVEKLPIRRGRKRVADSEVDRLQSRKRVLRSSNIVQIDNKSNPELPVIQKENIDQCLHVNEEANSKCDEPIEKLNNLMQTENEHSMSVDGAHGGSVNLMNSGIGSNNGTTIIQNNLTVNSNQSLESAELNKMLDESCTPSDTSSTLNEVVENTTIIQLPEEQNCNSRIAENELSVEAMQENQRVIDESVKIQHTKVASVNETDTKILERKLRSGFIGMKRPVVEVIPLENDVITNCKNSVINYKDLDIFSEQPDSVDKVQEKPTELNQHIKENILCSALERYGVISVRNCAKKVPDSITNSICQKIEDSIADIIASPRDLQKKKMDDLINSLRHSELKSILSGLMKYLKDPTRKCELFNKVKNGAAPPMTKSEVILLYVIEHLNGLFPSRGFIHRLWNNIEHALFQLNRAPHFDIIESMSHFYAVMCRYFRNKSRLRCFMLDAMYCLQFKAVPLIRQCLDVCPGVLPNAHEHMAKTSLVTCLVYLLHFYKCQDKYNRAQDIRTILYQKYSYRFSEWNETMILEIFRKAIMDLRGTHNDKKMLRLALIILCKRHGAKWCHTNIIRNMLLPIIEKQHVPDRIKQFCVLMLGPLLKPFPADKKAQCEIVINQLLQMLQQTPSHDMMEAIYSSLIFMNKHDPDTVVTALLAWNPKNVSKDFEETLNDYVMEKPLTVWKKLVTKKPNICT